MVTSYRPILISISSFSWLLMNVIILPEYLMIFRTSQLWSCAFGLDFEPWPCNFKVLVLNTRFDNKCGSRACCVLLYDALETVHETEKLFRLVLNNTFAHRLRYSSALLSCHWLTSCQSRE